MSEIHICAPRPWSVTLERQNCPTCERRRYFVVACYEWYGPNATCLWCGEHFDEEGRAPRPFARGWRKRSVAQAKRFYRRMATPTAHRAGQGE